MSEPAQLPNVTVIVPCRDEARFIGGCLQSIVDNGYPKERLQVVVIDGLSTDGTTKVVDQFSNAHRCVTRIDNAKRITPAALNLGIAAALGDYILWMSAHNQYDRGYIGACIEWATRSGADNVGGIIVTKPREPTSFGRAVCAVLTHPFGVGNSRFRTSSSEPVWVDTVFGGCYRRDVFARVGLFNERLVRGQDLEFNLRLRKAGLRTLLVPSIRSTYYARSRALEFTKHNWVNGVWAILPFRYSDIVPISPRHLAPMLFVMGVLVTAILGIFVHSLWWLPVLALAAYGTGALAATADIARNEPDWRVVAFLPLAFALLHFGYGFGSLWGAMRSPWALIKHLLAMPGRRIELKEVSGSPL
jgi:glycosyltransferase involved in cell wall biosynthesis